MRDDILALLEEGPTQPGEIAHWLNADTLTVIRELRALERLGVTKRQDDGTTVRWTLTGKPLPPVPVRKPRKLREDAPAADAPVAKDADPAWWVGKSREEFSAIARERFQHMRMPKRPAKRFTSQNGSL